MNPYNINPLGGYDVGRGISQIGNAFAGMRQREQQALEKQEAQQKQEQMQQLYSKAAMGDAEAIGQLYATQPKMGQLFEQRQQEKVQALGAAQAQESKRAETDWGLKWIQSETPEQKQVLLQEALNNPLIDIDESDLGGEAMSNDLAVNAMLYGHLGKDSYNDLIAGNEPEQMTEYQAAMVAGNNANRDIRQQELEIKKLEAQEKNLDRDIRRETNDLKKQELEAKLNESRVQKEQFKQQDQTRINNAIFAAEDKKATINELLKNQDYIDTLTGYAGRVPINITDKGVEAEKTLNKIKNSMTIENLSVMSGPKTDSDIAIIASASSMLGTGMSDAALKKELNKINKAYDRVIKNYNKELAAKNYTNKAPIIQPSANNEDVPELNNSSLEELKALSLEELKALRSQQ